MIGGAMDRTRTRFGRYRVWYALGIPLLILSIYKILNPPADAGTGYLVLWLLVTYTGTSITGLSHAAWAAALATGYNERSRIYGWMQAVAVAGSVTLLLMPLLTHGAIQPGKGESMQAIGYIIICLIPFTAAASIFFAPEKITTEKPEHATLKDYMQVFTQPSMVRLVIADLFLVLGPGTTGPIYIFFFHDAKGFPITQVSLLLIPYIGRVCSGAVLGAHRSEARQTPHPAGGDGLLRRGPDGADGDPQGPVRAHRRGHVRRRLLRQRLRPADPRHGGRRRRRAAAEDRQGTDRPALRPGDHDPEVRVVDHRGHRIPGAGLRRLQRQGRRHQHRDGDPRPGDVLPVRPHRPGAGRRRLLLRLQAGPRPARRHPQPAGRPGRHPDRGHRGRAPDHGGFGPSPITPTRPT
uniref:MFS transporter n=1 Tax=Phenylobacterium glaciei TaxID=2803784 RepID=A0A974P6M7_9CAUL|nr:MFS transporter [Phenylobacterium glaciei]